jgi:hypothetical protein
MFLKRIAAWSSMVADPYRRCILPYRVLAATACPGVGATFGPQAAEVTGACAFGVLKVGDVLCRKRAG